MIKTSLSAATVIYSCLSAVGVEHHKIAHAAFKEFSLKLRNFERALRDEVENEYWKSFVRNLKRYRFDVTAAPLGFGNPNVISADLIRNLQARLTQCAMLYPQFATSSQELLHSLEKLVEANDNPLLDYISGSNTFAPPQKLTVLLKEARLITMFEDILDSRPH